MLTSKSGACDRSKASKHNSDECDPELVSVLSFSDRVATEQAIQNGLLEAGLSVVQRVKSLDEEKVQQNLETEISHQADDDASRAC